MPAYKNKENGSWYVVTQYTDWTGERKPKCKRGFATRREALEWEQKFQQQNAGDLDMSFEAFCEIYTNDLKARLKESTWQTKENKSFFMAQLAYHISTGQPLWNYEVHQGTVLYLALEDDYQRLQERMSRMFGVEGTDTDTL